MRQSLALNDATATTSATFWDQYCQHLSLQLEKTLFALLEPGWYRLNKPNYACNGALRVGESHNSLECKATNSCFICIYQPRTRESRRSALCECPKYDLEVSICASTAPVLVLLGFRGVEDFFALLISFQECSLRLFHFNDCRGVPICNAKHSSEDSQRFYALLHSSILSKECFSPGAYHAVKIIVQMNSLNVSINGVCLLEYQHDTATKNLPESDGKVWLRNFNGLPGLCCINRTKVEFKSFRFTPHKSSTPNATSSTESRPSTKLTIQPSVATVVPSIGTANISSPEQGSLRELCLSRLAAVHDRKLLEQTLQDLLLPGGGELINFEHIAALQTAKRVLQEAVLLPLLLPEFFTGLRQPWKVILHILSSSP